MSDYDSHLILHHLDDPLRILNWTLDEAASLMLPVFVGLGFERPLLGLMASGACFYALRRLKKKAGPHTLRHGLYWYLPHTSRKLPKTPPSFIREYVA